MLLDDIGIQPVRNVRKVTGPHHSIKLVARQTFRVDEKYCKELGVDVPGVPESHGQLVVRLDLCSKLPDVTYPNAELITPSTILFVMRTHLLVTERLQLRESVLESHCLVSLLEMRDNGG